MKFMKTTLLSGAAMLTKILVLFGINKILAVYVGPAGYALLGNFQNFVQLVASFANGAINNGITKYTAEFYDQPETRLRLWQTGGTVSLISSVVTAAAVLLLASYLSETLMGNNVSTNVIRLFALSIPFYVANAFLLAILNGKKEIRTFVFATICGSILSLILIAVLTYGFGLTGSLYALATYQAIAFLSTALLCSRMPWFSIRAFFGSVDKDLVKRLLGFSLMAAISSILMPVTQILIRAFLIKEHGNEFAGYWEALSRISNAYLMMMTMTLGVYFLPRFSELKAHGDLKRELYKGLGCVIPLAVCGSLMIYLFKELVVRWVLSDAFQPANQFIGVQLIGDTFKITSWLLGYVLWARALVKTFIITEVIFSLGYYLLTLVLFPFLGEWAVFYAYMANYLLYLVTLAVFFVFWFSRQRDTNHR